MRVFSYTENYASETVTFITNELRELDKQHELLLAYSHRKNPDRYFLKRMVHLPYRFNRIVNKLRWWMEQSQIHFSLKNQAFRKKLNHVISAFNPSIIHCHFGTDFLKVAANLRPEHKKIPTLVSFYGFDVTERIKNKSVLKRYKQLLNSPNVYSVAVSESLVNNINTYIKPYNPAKLLHSGIDTEFFKRIECSAKSAGYTFLQVSSFTEKKGHAYTLQAFKKFLEQNDNKKFRFIIAGFGPLKHAIQAQIESLQLQNQVELRGPVTPAEMVQLASTCDCFVHMSVTAKNGDQEGLPNVLLEAMSLELPVLSTRHAGIPEIVSDGVNGILCEEKNIEDYVRGFKTISDWELCPRNRQRIIDYFSLDSHMKQLNELYSSIAGTSA